MGRLRKRSPPADPQAWLRRARSNLLRAKGPKLHGVFWEDYCFDAQQAAEKALKAVLVPHRTPPQRTHDLDQLLDALRAEGVRPPPKVGEASKLTVYAVVHRYPGFEESLGKKDMASAVSIAEAVVRWADRAPSTH